MALKCKKSVAQLHTVTTTFYKSPQHPLSPFPACCIFNSCSLTTTSNRGDSSASCAHVVTVQRIFRNWTNYFTLVNWTAFSRSRSLLPATSRHAYTRHRAPLGPMAIYLFNVKTYVFFSFSWSSSLIKEGLVFYLYIYIDWCSLTTPYPTWGYFSPLPGFS
jgi:hypothetical protein